MLKKRPGRKLTLSRETVRLLAKDRLEAVAGGNTLLGEGTCVTCHPVTICASCTGCPTVCHTLCPGCT